MTNRIGLDLEGAEALEQFESGPFPKREAVDVGADRKLGGGVGHRDQQIARAAGMECLEHAERIVPPEMLQRLAAQDGIEAPDAVRHHHRQLSLNVGDLRAVELLGKEVQRRNIIAGLVEKSGTEPEIENDKNGRETWEKK